MQFAIQDCFVKILSTGILEEQATRKVVNFINVNTAPLNFERKRKRPSSSNMKRSECWRRKNVELKASELVKISYYFFFGHRGFERNITQIATMNTVETYHFKMQRHSAPERRYLWIWHIGYPIQISARSCQLVLGWMTNAQWDVLIDQRRHINYFIAATSKDKFVTFQLDYALFLDFSTRKFLDWRSCSTELQSRQLDRSRDTKGLSSQDLLDPRWWCKM